MSTVLPFAATDSAVTALDLVDSPLVEHDQPLHTIRVAVLGLGYVGLPTALALHHAGFTVVGIDIDPARLGAIRDRRVDLLPSDHARLAAGLDHERFVLTEAADVLPSADMVMICVPTPVDAHHTPDLRALRAACATAVRHARAGQTLLLTSTSYVGTTRELLVEPLRQRGLRPGADVHVAFSPERVDPGNESHPQQAVPRVVGGVTRASAAHAAAVLTKVAAGVHEVSSPEAAEMTKLLENSFRAVNIAFANETATVARELGLDVMEVIRAAATKPYGFMPFYPGPGIGGHCIPCDPHYLLWQMRASQVVLPVLGRVMDSVAQRPAEVVVRAREVLADAGVPVAGARVLVVGVAYKPGVADVRESPALEILARLDALGAEVAMQDPFVPAIALTPTRRLESVTSPAAATWDLVLVHTLHAGTDVGWVPPDTAVLDATFRLDAPAHRTGL